LERKRPACNERSENGVCGKFKLNLRKVFYIAEKRDVAIKPIALQSLRSFFRKSIFSESYGIIFLDYFANLEFFYDFPKNFVFYRNFFCFRRFFSRANAHAYA
jgi:hypothetical protein